MVLLKHVYPVSYAYYQLIVTFLVLGLVKLTDFYQQDAMKKFRSLPKWFWTVTSVWELAIPLTLHFNYTLIALILTFIIMGGVIFALFFIKDYRGKTQMEASFGTAIIPVIHFMSPLSFNR